MMKKVVEWTIRKPTAKTVISFAENKKRELKKEEYGKNILMEMKRLVVLTKYKKAYEKIAMGLLSFMPGEHQLKQLQKTMRTYEENPDWQLYLWKKGEDFVGLIGIEVDEHSFTVRHASVNPSFRGEGIGQALVEKVQQLMEPREMRATPETEAFLAKCRESKDSL